MWPRVHRSPPTRRISARMFRRHRQSDGVEGHATDPPPGLRAFQWPRRVLRTAQPARSSSRANWAASRALTPQSERDERPASQVSTEPASATACPDGRRRHGTSTTARRRTRRRPRRSRRRLDCGELGASPGPLSGPRRMRTSPRQQAVQRESRRAPSGRQVSNSPRPIRSSSRCPPPRSRLRDRTGRLPP